MPRKKTDKPTKPPAATAQHYAEQWLVLDRKSLNPLTREEAQRRHTSREQYAAVIGEPEAPSHVVSLAGPWVTASFLDDDRREYLMYSFKELRPGHIFLKQAIYREFDDESAELSIAMIFAFDEKGGIIVERQDRQKGKTETRKAKADPQLNWDRFPEFGAYETLLREERHLPK
jgi:hypothetical protein